MDSSCNKPVSVPVSVPKGVVIVDPPERVLCGPEGVHRGRGELVLEEPVSPCCCGGGGCRGCAPGGDWPPELISVTKATKLIPITVESD